MMTAIAYSRALRSAARKARQQAKSKSSQQVQTGAPRQQEEAQRKHQ